MRMAGAGALMLLVLEILLLLAFVAGSVWVGGWQGGVVLAAVILLLIALPWLGDLTVWLDSARPFARVRIGWWGAATFRGAKDPPELEVRILGIPIRRKITPSTKRDTETVGKIETPEPGSDEEREMFEEMEREGPPEVQEKASTLQRVWRQIDPQSVEGFSRVATAGLKAATDLIWDAHEITISVMDPTEKPIVDGAIEQTFGRRGLGPLDLTFSANSGKRRILARYRIGLLRAAMSMVQMAIDGRVLAFSKMMKRRNAQERERVSHDQKMIDEILDKREGKGDGTV